MSRVRRPRSPVLPALGRVVILPDPPLSEVGSLVVPERPRHRGVVLAVAPDVDTVAAGDHVVHAKNVGVQVEVGGAAYLVLRASDLLAVID